jgi:hypothetical protein
MIEGLPTVDRRIIALGAIRLTRLPVPILLPIDGYSQPVGMIYQVDRTDGPLLQRRSLTAQFPTNTSVLSGLGALDYGDRTTVAQLTRETFPQADVAEVELGTIEGGVLLTGGELAGVTLGTTPAWPDVYWELDPDRINAERR